MSDTEKQYVRSDDTGELVEVIPTLTTVAIAHVSTLSNKDGIGELPPGSAKEIEQAMVRAIEWCHKEGITEPDKMREVMLQAREGIKQKLRQQVIDWRARVQAAAQAAEKAAQEK